MKNGVCIHGNMPVDHIMFTRKYPTIGTNNSGHSYKKQLGGAHTVAKTLAELGVTCAVNTAVGTDDDGAYVLTQARKGYWLNYDIIAGPTSKAFITIDRETGSRTSLVAWGACTQTTGFAEVGKRHEWNHFAYWDHISCPQAELEELKKEGCILSCDFAYPSAGYALDLFDYVFISDEEVWENPDTMPNNFIVHTSESISVKGLSFEFNKNENVLNPLGAGDRLAAVLISKLLKNPSLSKFDLVQAQKVVEEMLLTQ